MENSAQKAGFAIASMIILIVVAGIGVDWWDAYHLRKANGGLPSNPVSGAAVEQQLKEQIAQLEEEVRRLKAANAASELIKLQNDQLKEQLQAAEKKDLKPLEKEPEALKLEDKPVKAQPASQNDEPLTRN